jgi:sugar lactone lactonase YvrE
MRHLLYALTLATVFAFAASCVNDPIVPDSSGSPPPPAGGLWTISGSSSAILYFDPAQVRDTVVDATTVITTPSAALNTLAAVAFDRAGSLWVIGMDDPVLLAFEPGALASSGFKSAHTIVVPTAVSLRSPTGLAFDANQRLWVADFSGTLNRFDVQQIAEGGMQPPRVVVNVGGNASSIAFDAEGSLWVSDNVNNAIRKYTAEQLATSGSPDPDVVLRSTNLSLVNPAGLAFDALGNLWVANIGGRTLASFSPEKLHQTGSPLPDVVITGSEGALAVPVALAFDAAGSLWVIGGTGALTKYSRSSLQVSGAAVPALRVQIAERSLFWSIAFWPIPNGLPLGQRFSSPPLPYP